MFLVAVFTFSPTHNRDLFCIFYHSPTQPGYILHVYACLLILKTCASLCLGIGIVPSDAEKHPTCCDPKMPRFMPAVRHSVKSGMYGAWWKIKCASDILRHGKCQNGQQGKTPQKYLYQVTTSPAWYLQRTKAALQLFSRWQKDKGTIWWLLSLLIF